MNPLDRAAISLGYPTSPEQRQLNALQDIQSEVRSNRDEAYVRDLQAQEQFQHEQRMERLGL
jgi:hypothetical protein